MPRQESFGGHNMLGRRVFIVGLQGQKTTRVYLNEHDAVRDLGDSTVCEYSRFATGAPLSEDLAPGSPGVRWDWAALLEVHEDVLMPAHLRITTFAGKKEAWKTGTPIRFQAAYKAPSDPALHLEPPYVGPAGRHAIRNPNLQIEGWFRKEGFLVNPATLKCPLVLESNPPDAPRWDERLAQVYSGIKTPPGHPGHAQDLAAAMRADGFDAVVSVIMGGPRGHTADRLGDMVLLSL